MPQVTYDGRSFMLDGRRVWIVGASMDLARTPSASWRDRLHAIRAAGFNTVETRVFWSRCEARPGVFDFSGNNDVRGFVRLAQELDLWVILRPGPYVGGGWDLGGVPTWVLDLPDVRLRSPNQPFLEAASRYITALSREVKDLQVSSSGEAGPIIGIQNEHDWSCGDDTKAAGYLGELHRYYREAGLSVPILNTNRLWATVEGEINCWTGEEDMLGLMRELNRGQPDQPKFVLELGRDAPARFGAEAPEPLDGYVLQRRFAEALAAGAQVSASPFVGGITPGFFGGRLPEEPEGFLAPDWQPHAPLTEAGGATPAYHAVRRIAGFARHFGRVFSALEHDRVPVILDPNPEDDAGEPVGVPGFSVTYQSGPQGAVAFVFRDEAAQGEEDTASLMMPDGAPITVPFGRQSVAWCVFNAHLGGRTTLDYCGLCALGFVGRVLVVSGPAGSVGMLSINGGPLDVEVPEGTHELIEHENFFVLVVDEEIADTVWITADSVIVGAESVRADGTPVLPEGRGKACRVSKEGEVTELGARDGVRLSRSPEKPVPSAWLCARGDEYLQGTSPRFASIEGPADLASLGSPFGYGWYRIGVKASAAKRIKVMAPESRDRLQLALDGEALGVLGSGPGAQPELGLSLKKGTHSLVVLADNMGRPATGSQLSEKKGLYGHIWEVSPFKVNKPTLEVAEPLSPLTFRSPLMGVRETDDTHPTRVTWAFQHRKKSPLFFRIGPAPLRGLVLLNGTAIAYLEAGESETIVLTDEMTTRGNNTVQFAAVNDFFDDESAAAELEEARATLGNAATFSEGLSEVSAKADWAFAKWEPPQIPFYTELSKSEMATVTTPAWWKTSFEATAGDVPLYAELTGMTKGQIYLNGTHLGRYFVADAAGTPVPPMTRILLPDSLLRETGNDLVLFDEHGGNPSKIRLTHETGPTPIRA